MADEQQVKKRPPAYVSYKTFKSAITGLDHVPDTIDYSVYASMNGTTRSVLFRALRFFDLIDDDGKPSDEFRRLTDGKEDVWTETIKSLVKSHYKGQLTALKSGTVSTLKKSFGDDIGSSIVSPACRFLVQAAQDVGLPVSPSIEKGNFGTASPRSRRTTKKSKQQTPGNNGDPPKDSDDSPRGNVRFPIPIAGKQSGYISVPEDITESDLPMLLAMFAAVEQFAKQNAG